MRRKKSKKTRPRRPQASSSSSNQQPEVKNNKDSAEGQAGPAPGLPPRGGGKTAEVKTLGLVRGDRKSRSAPPPALVIAPELDEKVLEEFTMITATPRGADGDYVYEEHPAGGIEGATECMEADFGSPRSATSPRDEDEAEADGSAAAEEPPMAGASSRRATAAGEEPMEHARLQVGREVLLKARILRTRESAPDVVPEGCALLSAATSRGACPEGTP